MTERKDEKLIDAEKLASALDTFANERDWRQFHSPKNLVMALSGEVGELTEIFQWMSEGDSWEAARHPGTANSVKEEIADVLLYLVRLSSVLGIDLNQAAADKLALNAIKYPAEQSRCSSKKYTDL